MRVFDASKNADPQWDEFLKLQEEQRDQFAKGLVSIDQIKWFNGLSLERREQVMDSPVFLGWMPAE